MSDDYRAEWKTGSDFAEFAEALGITTAQIISAVKPKGDVWLVLFTPDPDPESRTVHSMALKRDDDGILRSCGEASLLPGFWDDLEKHMRDAGFDDR
jgi:hypothetical protein